MSASDVHLASRVVLRCGTFTTMACCRKVVHPDLSHNIITSDRSQVTCPTCRSIALARQG